MSTLTHARLGHRVIYVLSEQDVRDIIGKRLNAGRGTFTGNDPREGDHYAAIIVRDWHADTPMPVTVGDIQFLVSAEHDGIPGPNTTAKIKQWQEAHNLDPDGKWGPNCEAALRLERLNAAPANLQVFLDGNDSWWSTSRSAFNNRKHGEITPAGYEAIDLGAEYEDIIANPEYWKTDAKGHFYYA